MKRLLLLTLIPALAACADVPDINRSVEAAFQVAHAVDTAQTYHGAASDPCYAEGDPVTRRIIGREPSKAGVIAWGVGYGALHYGVYRLLANHGHDYLASAWEAMTIESTGRSVANNISVGVRLGAPNVHADCRSAAHGDVLLHPGVQR